MKTFVQYGPDGKMVDKIVIKDDKVALALYDWVYKMRNEGYVGPFLLKGMVAKIEKEKLWKNQVATIV